MSGFEGFAAAIGVAELTLRSIFRAYEFIRDLKNVPEHVARLLSELQQLNNYLLELASLAVEGSPARPVIQRLGLSESVKKCGDTCSKLETNLKKWTEGGAETASSRFRVRANKSHIDSAIQDINSTKGTLHFAVTIASFRLQADDMSGKRPTKVAEKNGSRVPDSKQTRRREPEFLFATDTSSMQKQMIHQPRPALDSNEDQRQATSGGTRNGADSDKSTGPESGGPEEINGLDVTEVHDTENHNADENDVQESEGTRIGAPSSVTIKNFSSNKNKVLKSPNTNIGRW